MPALGIRYACNLKYPIRLVENRINPEFGKGVVMMPVPAEECPKPKTWAEYDNEPLNKAKGQP